MPQNEGFYHAAYIVAVVVYGGYIASLWWRARRVRERLDRSAGGRVDR